MLIHVTQKHIDDANAARKTATWDICTQCPVARAVRKIPGWEEASANRFSFQLWNDNGTPKWVELLPEHASAFVERFDQGKTCQPFSFESEKAPL